MNNKDKTKCKKMFQEGDFPFSFEKFEKMAEMMRNCCSGDKGMVDCCSMIRKMMRCGEGEELATKKKKETGVTE